MQGSLIHRTAIAVAVSVTVGRGVARAGDDPTPPDPGPAPSPAPGASLSSPRAPDPSPSNEPSEVIEVTGTTPAAPGTITLDARTARRAPGALGEPLRALALLPGVVSAIAASGYPIIRGTLPGESRFAFDGIELPLLYHFGFASQVIHPSFIGDLQLRAGGYGVEQGNLIGGLVAMTPSTPEATRTELRANPVEIGAYRFQVLSKATSVAVAARVGTLALVKVYNPDDDLYYVDQQTRFVHQLDNGDRVTLTSLAAFDYYGRPDVGVTLQSDKLGFHRFDARWTRARNGWMVRAGLETQLDTLRSKTVWEQPIQGGARPPSRNGGSSYGVRGYADASVALTPWLRTRAGIEARHRALRNGRSPFLEDGHSPLSLQADETPDPYLGQATSVDASGAWAALDLRIANLTFTPGVRGDVYRAELYRSSNRHTTVDPRLAVTAELPRGVRAELSAGRYSAPPQVSVFHRDMVIGPLPMTDGLGSNAGINHAVEADAAIRTPLGPHLEARAALYYRDTHRAIDFGVVNHLFHEAQSCRDFPAPYRDLDTRNAGAELMVRGELSPSVSGWLSYSLAKSERDFGFVELPGDFDQRHTFNVTGQWRHGRWLLGATGSLHTGRAMEYPQTAECGGDGTSSFTSLDAVRRPPINGRIDLRAERAYQFADWRMSLYFEIQNATLTKETVNYEVDPLSGRVVPQTVFLPLALVGLEVVL